MKKYHRQNIYKKKMAVGTLWENSRYSILGN
nr:MAG TPA: hypothetical protein [Bacteriophage sp.]